ncbi:hypothetical protein, partial [Actinoplanes cyaneus]
QFLGREPFVGRKMVAVIAVEMHDRARSTSSRATASFHRPSAGMRDDADVLRSDSWTVCRRCSREMTAANRSAVGNARMMTPVSSRSAIAKSWVLVTYVLRQNPGILVAETHPGSGRHDCLTLLRDHQPIIQIDRCDAVTVLTGADRDAVQRRLVGAAG